MKKTALREYARLIVRCGVNVQKGQTVLVMAGLDQPEFVQMVVVHVQETLQKRLEQGQILLCLVECLQEQMRLLVI